jgi:dipeptidase E
VKLFLGGGGGGRDSIELDKKFVASLDLSKPLLYIPIATNTTKYPYSGCVSWLLSVLSPLGVKNVVMWVEEDLKTKTKEDFDQFCGVYIGGGNTYKLLKELKDFGTFDILSLLAKEGVSIYGGSAGAIILAKTIIPAGFLDENKVGLIDFSALNLVHGYDVWCHYTGAEDDSIQEYMNKYGLEKVIAIPEDAGIVVSESEIEVVGPGEVVSFSSERVTHESGSRIKTGNKIYFISGVSGVGKTSTLNHLKSSLPADRYDVRDLDENGVPDGGGLEWLNKVTRYWLNVAKENATNGRSTVICGFANPSLFNEVYIKGKDVDAELILLHASGHILEERLRRRHSTPESVKEIERASGVPVEQFIQNNVDFAPKFRKIFEKYNYPVIDTDEKMPDQVADEIIKFIG